MRSYVVGAILSAAIFLLMVAAVVQATPLFVMAGSLILILIVGRVQAELALRWVKLKRIAPAAVGVGEHVAIRYRVTSEGRARTPLMTVDEAYDDDSWMKNVTLAPPFSPPPAGSMDVEGGFTPTRRGCYVPSRVTLQAGDTLGVCVRERSFPAAKEPLLVLPQPDPVPLDLTSLAGWGLSEAESGQTEGGGIDPRGVREYLPGDSLRHIHWRSSARMNRLQVRQFEAGNMADATLILDTCLPRRAEQPDPVLERAIRNVAFVARELLRAGTTVRLLGQGLHGAATQPKRGMRHYQTILEGLAAVEATHDTDVAAYTQRVMLDIPSHSTVFWFTADPAGLPAIARELLRRSCVPNLYLYRRGGPPDEPESGVVFARWGIRAVVVPLEEAQA
jgi:uncharacterized protein (DUF58 family)